MNDDAAECSPDHKACQALLDDLKAEVRRCGGGPVQYLEKHAEAAGFREWLLDHFPLQDEFHYSHEKNLQPIEEKEMSDVLPLTVHVSALGFSRECSLKPPCGLDLMMTLCDLYLKDGFTTAGEPLLVLQQVTPSISKDLPALDEDGLQTFSLGYLKGFARAASLLCLLHFMKKQGLNVKKQYPTLWETVIRIRVHHIKTESRLNEALTNMKISCKGSIRKATNTVQCVFMLKSLMKVGVPEPMALVKQWNAMSARAFQISGKRMTTLKLLFDSAPKARQSLIVCAVLDDILDHVQSLGWDTCVWSDDNLSTKKLYPKFQFPARSKAWQQRLRTSEDSMTLAVRRLQQSHVRLPEYQRKKPDCHSVEEISAMAACAVNLTIEIQKLAPIAQSKLEAEFLQPFGDGCPNVAQEIEVALLEKSEAFDIRNMQTFRRLLDEQVFARPVSASKIEEDSLVVDRLNLVIKQCQYDQQVFHNWMKKVSNLKNEREQQEHTWKLSQRAKCSAAAELFCKSCLRFEVWDPKKPESAIASIMDFRRLTITGKLGLSPDSKDVATLIWLNSSAPSLVPVGIVNAYMQTLSWALHDQLRGMAVVLSPTFSYGRGKLHIEEKLLMESLAKAGNHNLDWHFSILFNNKTDQRDQRPMNYQGRLVFSSVIDPTTSPFWNCDLRKTQQITTDQLPARAMREPENLSEDSLPESTDVRSASSGASKYWQIGPGACDAMLSATLTNLSPQPLGTLIVDLYVRTGEFAEAFLKQRANRPNTFFIGFCESQTEGTWVETVLKSSLTDSYLAGAVMPGGDKVPEKMPEDLCDPLPPQPRLNLLASGVIRDGKLAIPVEIVKEWGTHPLAKDFQDWLKCFQESGGEIVAAAGADSEADQKRKAAGNPDSEPAAKKKKGAVKIDEALIGEADAISQALLHECKVTVTKDSVGMLQVRAGSEVWLVNKGPKDFVAEFHQVCGFGRGSFKLMKPEEQPVEGQRFVEFKLTDYQDMIYINNQCLTVGQAVAQQRLTKPDCKVSYHEIVQDAEKGLNEFSLRLTHRVVFSSKMEEVTAEATFGNLALKENNTIWSESKALCVLWHCRWTAKGLTPVKPAVHLKGGITVKPGKALNCHQK
ncbi:unnamed protein product [Symbiodinium sp. CCMP2592]|nr:unnamed protein product [Symbiodinium sp. CCMP2592]CAE7709057.1 unnamed protein product [Symbiodinium sp. CCMP2592]